MMPRMRPVPAVPPPEELLEELPPLEDELLEEPPDDELPELEPLLEPELLPLDEPPEELLLEVQPPELELPELEPLEPLELEVHPVSAGVLSSLQPYMKVPPTARLVTRHKPGTSARRMV
jgi:hypothetical protein